MYSHHMLTQFAAPPEHIMNAVSDSSIKMFAKDRGDSVEVSIVGAIGEDMFGEGVSAAEVRSLLKSNRGKPVDLVINSPGGLVYDGLQIYNVLIGHDAEITATIEGLAYSAASFVAMAADRIRMYEASDIGMHRAWGFAMGNRTVMLDTAEWLENTDRHLIDIYTARTGQSEEQITQWLDGAVDGTLFSAKEAVEAGLADEVIPVKSRQEKSQAALTPRKTFARLSAARNRLRLG